MSTIERAAARLGAIGKLRVGPELRDTSLADAQTREALNSASPAASGTTAFQPQIGGGYCEVNLDALTAAGFATSKNVNVEIATDLRRIKRPLLLAIKKSAA